MSYIFISFSEYLDNGSKGKNDFYNDSLTEQYNQLQKRIPSNRRDPFFKTFIEKCFPSGMQKKYYFSCPNFKREKQTTDYSSYLRNVIIRPELTLQMKEVLPDNQNVILIGDIYEGQRLKCFKVKGIQLIDNSISSQSDVVFEAAACLAFVKNEWSVDYVDYSDTLLTEDNIAELIRNCWTVSDHVSVQRKYDEWNQYIAFRNYYLSEQSKRNFLLDNVTYIESYAVNRKEYKRNSVFYDEYLLDGKSDFKRGEMVVLSKKIYEAEDFPLVRIDIDRNKKEFYNNAEVKNGKKYNDEERRIRSLSKDNVFITQLDPSKLLRCKNSERDAAFKELLREGYELGDRFKLIRFEVLPEEHLNSLQVEYEYDLDSSFKTIESKYEKIIKDELNKAKESKQVELQEIINNKIAILEKDLDAVLESDIKDNSDADILKAIKKEKNSIKTKLAISIIKGKKESQEDYKKRFDEAYETEVNKIDITSLYIERNKKKISEFKKQLEQTLVKALSTFEKEKNKELHNKYAEDIRNEKIKTQEDLSLKLKEDKDRAIEDETIIRFSLYFSLNDINTKPSEKSINKINACKYIVYDSRAEKAKIKRQEQALFNFFNGYVKNPYLSTYLFSPSELKRVEPEYEDWHWYLDSLNEKQKEAVRKAVYSNGIFLLQGPPGTGKTQVIAETVAQMVKKGKKVLISSETHKAIDNVFERLPKIGDIVPIRLIYSHNNKGRENDYDPKYLVDNFYGNISSNMKRAINRYNNFQQNKDEFNEKFGKLKINKAKLDKNSEILNAAKKEIAKLEAEAKIINNKIDSLDDEKDLIRIKLDVFRRTNRHIEKNILNVDEDIDQSTITEYRESLQSLFDKETYYSDDIAKLIKTIDSLTAEEIYREVSIINPKSRSGQLNEKRNKLRDLLASCKNDYDEIIPDKADDYYKYQTELKEVVNELNSCETKVDLGTKLSKIFKPDYLVDNLEIIEEVITTLKNRINEKKSQFAVILERKIAKEEENEALIDKEINDKRAVIKDLNEQIDEINERNDVKEIIDATYELEQAIRKFFKDFEISEPYKNIDDALSIISSKWNELETDFAAKEKENKQKIPMYEKIVDYISSEDVIETDRKEYTKALFESANVFGMTCTSRDNFRKGSMSVLNDYNIDDLDIKKVGIDVVIIDEVSKSCFLDLLIPILYGKTVILVGDHRQLPPMYEFAKLRPDDFEGLDEEIINPSINKKYTELYEECFFKSLFEKIPNYYKTMLTQQYRCHEDIMNVFNHFYQGQLKLGFKGQNNEKQHNINLVSNGRTIIEPSKHIYFVDCKTNETHEDDSTSMYNMGEAKVVVELIRKLNEFFKKNPNREKLSIGVISTYGDQAGRIKQLLKSEKVKTDAFKTKPEKMIVSTVDDFQGDERDIIILTTVRNPEKPEKSNPGFILAYQRINVALSRARRLLIMVGNRKYLENKGVINLPDVNGDHTRDQNNFRVYERIIETIEHYGKVIQDIDVLEDKEVKIDG